MFASPCSLRSASCAVLITLAAAAGLSRMTPQVNASISPDSDSTLFSSERYALSIGHVFTGSWLKLVRLFTAASEGTTSTSEQVSDCPPTPLRGVPTLSSIATASQHATPASRDRVVWSSRRHEIPYAAGPPTRGFTRLLPARFRSGPDATAEVVCVVDLVSLPESGKSSVRVGANPDEVSLVHLLFDRPVSAGERAQPDCARSGESSCPETSSEDSDPALPFTV